MATIEAKHSVHKAMLERTEPEAENVSTKMLSPHSASSPEGDRSSRRTPGSRS